MIADCMYNVTAFMYIVADFVFNILHSIFRFGYFIYGIWHFIFRFRYFGLSYGTKPKNYFYICQIFNKYLEDNQKILYLCRKCIINMCFCRGVVKNIITDRLKKRGVHPFFWGFTPKVVFLSCKQKKITTWAKIVKKI